MATPRSERHTIIDQGILTTGTLVSDLIYLAHYENDNARIIDGVAIQVVWSSSLDLDGEMCVEVSLNGTHWSELPNSLIKIDNTSDNFIWTIENPAYGLARVKYVGAAGTGVVTALAQIVGYGQR